MKSVCSTHKSTRLVIAVNCIDKLKEDLPYSLYIRWDCFVSSNDAPLCSVIQHVGWVNDVSDAFNVLTSCQFGWISTGCQPFYHLSSCFESDPNDILRNCHCYFRCGVDGNNLGSSVFVALGSCSPWCEQPCGVCHGNHFHTNDEHYCSHVKLPSFDLQQLL